MSSSRDDEIAAMQAQTDDITDESLDTTRRIRQMAEESRQMGAETLNQLDEQGRTLNKIEKNLDKINEDVQEGEKSLAEMEKCCGLCVCPWNRPKPLSSSAKYKGTWGSDENQRETAAERAERDAARTRQSNIGNDRGQFK